MKTPKLYEVVIFVVGIAALAVLFLPVRVGDHPAHRTHCISNVKQLALAHTLYLADNDRYCGPVWTEAIAPYVKNPMIYRCRLDEPKKETFSMAMSPWLCGQPEPVDPASVILLFEKPNAGKNALGTEVRPISDEHGPVAVGYADGHVKAMPLKIGETFAIPAPSFEPSSTTKSPN